MQLVWRATVHRAYQLHRVTKDPMFAVRSIISQDHWREVAQSLQRSLKWCQKRYFELLQAKLSSTEPAEPSCVLGLYSTTHNRTTRRSSTNTASASISHSSPANFRSSSISRSTTQTPSASDSQHVVHAPAVEQSTKPRSAQRRKAKGEGGVELVDGQIVTHRCWAEVNSIMHALTKRVEQNVNSASAVPVSRHAVPYLTTSRTRARRSISTTHNSTTEASGDCAAPISCRADRSTMKVPTTLLNGQSVNISTWTICAAVLRGIVGKIQQNASNELQIGVLNAPGALFPEVQPALRHAGLLYIHNKQFMTEALFPWQGTHLLDTKLPLKLPSDCAEKASKRYEQAVQRLESSQNVYNKSLSAIQSGEELSGRPQEMLRKCLETIFSLPMPPLYGEFNTLNRNEVRFICIYLLAL